MKRALMVSVLIALSAVAGLAQLGKTPGIPAGSPQDRALLAIEQESDLAKKIALLEKFVQEFRGDARLLGYRRLQASYLKAGEFDKAVLSALQALRLDPSDFATMTNLTRAFAQKQNVAQAFNYGILAAGLVQRLQAAGPPEGTPADIWENHKANLLERHRPDYQFLEYSLYQLGLQQSDPAMQAGLFERYLDAFTDSRYFSSAFQACLGAYQRTMNADKVLEVGEKTLARDPENPLLNVIAADALSEMGQHLERAETLAQAVPELADKAARPEHQSEEQWAQQQNTWKGLAYSIRGLILMHRADREPNKQLGRKKTAEAIEKFRQAEPLLGGKLVAHARNLFRLGFAHAKLGQLEPARRYLLQVVEIESPYKAAAEQLLTKVDEARAKRRP
ncbi:MAG: hypothetical protein ACE5H2_02660 [Terriglobia bacterium]